MIRNYLKKSINPKNVIDVYIPDIYGKEKRKTSFSKEGKLGVEGISKSIIIGSIKRACGNLQKSENRKIITKLDFYNLKLVGGKGSSANRKKLIKALDIPESVSSGGLLNIINSIMEYDEFIKVCKGLFAYND